MDLGFYNLKREPFNVTPDPEFLSLNKAAREALASIIYGVENRKGFIVITGEVGVGKTTVLRAYLGSADKKNLRIVYSFNSNVTYKELLTTICRELGLPVGTGEVFEMVNRLHRLLIKEYRQANNVVLIIDEAQNMPKETLENLRMLSNLETSTDKLLQIVLVGQPEFEEMLDLRELRQLKQRVAVRFRIPPLKGKESLAYIKDRLAKAATDSSSIFTRGALKLIARKANGVPRVINVLCANALVTGLGYRVRPVSTRIVKEVIADFEGEEKPPPPRRWRLAPASVFFVVICLFGFTPSETYWPDPEKIISQARLGLVQKTAPSFSKSFPVPVRNDHNGRKEAVDDIPRRKERNLPAVRILKKGDSLYLLTKDIYGFANPELMNWIKQNNPQIRDIHRLQEGERILFPEIAGTGIRKAR